MFTGNITMNEIDQAELRDQWVAKLGKQELDLVRQKAVLRDRLRMLVASGQAVEAGQVQLQLRELDKELQKVAEQINVIHRGSLLPYSED